MRYRFADCEFDSEHPSVLRRSGRAVTLQYQVSQVLVYLLEHHKRVISKDELAAQVWKGAIANATIESCIRKVRQALGDSGRTQNVLKTHSGFGYELVVPVEVLSPSPIPKPEPLPTPPPLPLPPSPVPLPSPFIEKKIVTILCCGVYLSATPHAETELDALHNQMRTLYRLVHQIAEQYEGTIQPITGNHVPVLFGAPVSQEDHAQRAVLAALGLRQHINMMASASQTVPPQPLAVRFGIHTGEVALGGVEAAPAPTMPAAVVGDAALLAMALQEAAAPGTILSSAVTIRLIEGMVHIEPAQPMQLSRQAIPLRVYKVLHRLPHLSPGTPRPRPLRQFVGRRHEMATLRQRLEQVTNGRGHVVGITGEPGIGKSRLLSEFSQRLRQRPLTYLEGHCWSYGRGIPYGPILTIVRQVCGINETDPPEVIVRRVHEVLRELEMPPADHAPPLLHLLGVQAESQPLLTVPAEELKTCIDAVLRRLVGQMAQRRPLVITIEDLHWSDPTSEALLTSMVDHIVGVPILLVVTYRPEYRPAWLDKSYATQLTLQPLTARDSRRLLQEVVPTMVLSDLLVRGLLAQADGNPFFVEELGQTMLEHGGPSAVVPSTIHAVLMARIDRLPPAAKQLLQVAAVIGNDIPTSMLEAVAELPDTVLYESLQHLQSAEFLYETRLLPTPVHTFKHVLTQEVAYQSLLPSTRQPYHLRSAQILAERFPETATVHPELLAHHYTEAGLVEQAIPYWQQAGQLALDRSANSEAVSHFTRGLQLLQTLPATPEHTRQELALQLALGPPLRMLKGHVAPEVEALYLRIHQLSQQVGDSRQQFSALVSLSRLYLNQARVVQAHEVAEQCLTLAQHVQQPGFLLEAHRIFGMILFWRGEFVAARRQLEQGIALYDARQDYLQTFNSAIDPGVVCLSALSWTLWMLGYPDQALARINEAYTLAQKLSHPYSLAFALNYASTLHVWRREADISRERAEAVITLSHEHGFIHALSTGMIKQGWAMVRQGLVAGGIKQLHAGLDAGQDTLSLPRYLSMLADAYTLDGQIDAALQLLDKALTHLENTGECHFEAELHRLRGESLLIQQTTSEQQAKTAEECFYQALHIARHQQAKLLELRATLSLCYLRQQQNRRTEAHQMLVEIYGWFTEGWETPDLREAKALLEALQ